MSLGSETRRQGDDMADADEVERDGAMHTAAEQALMVLLQHPSVMQQDHCVACKLLCTSKRLGELLAARCSGALELCCTPRTTEQADALGTWLSRHGRLLCSMELAAPWLGGCSGAARVRLLACIPGGLTRLALYHHCDGDAVEQEATVLARVLSRQVARLHSLVLPNWHCKGGAAEAARVMRPVMASVAALSDLTSLRLPMPHGRRCTDDEIMAQVEYGRAWVQHLPAQLQELELTEGPTRSSRASEWLALERLTGLTRLQIPRTSIDGGVLPRTLRWLEVRKCAEEAPWLATLQGLPQLTELHVDSDYGFATHELQQLSVLSSLRAVHLNIAAPVHSVLDDGNFYNARLHDASSALGMFPLVSLHASKQVLTPEVLSGLGRCTGLTYLTLFSAWLECATVQQLADCVVHLSALVTLSIAAHDGGFFDGPSGPAWSPGAGAGGGQQRAGWSALAQVVGRLPVMRSCDFKGLPLGSAAALLGAATQLTKLELAACGVNDSIVAGLCRSLRGLRQLDLYNSGVSDACLPAIAAALRQLTYLRLSRVGRGRGRGVTDASVQQLRAALPGLKVASVEDVYEESESEVDDE